MDGNFNGGSQNNDNGNLSNQSDSLYSYSYLNQENQERNPNYYERQEEQGISSGTGSNERTYVAGGASAHGNGNARNDQQFYTTGQSAQQGGNPYSASQNSGEAYSNPQSGGNYYSSSQNNGAPYQNQWNPIPEDRKNKQKKKRKDAGEKKPHGFGMAAAKCAALALVFGLVSGTVFYGTGLAFELTGGKGTAQLETTTGGGGNTDGTTNSSIPGTSVSTATTMNDVADIVDNVIPSIVSITNMGVEEFGDFFGRSFSQETESAGSGIIISQTKDEIYIATNNHVIANANQLTVNFADNQSVVAQVKGTDPSTDLAVISVAIKDIPAETMEKIKVATLGNSDDVRVGQGAVAIGNALGYGQSVTTGVVSALDREVTVEDERGGAITNSLLQTSAAINPGNSGGPLVNMKGEVIGINSVKYNDTQVEGMGFAIPISTAEPIINDLITREIVDKSNSSHLGVNGQDVTEGMSNSFGIPEGLYITYVEENSAAEQAGIRKGDVMTEFDGRKVRSRDGLEEILRYYAAGTEVKIKIQANRNGEWQEQELTAVLGKKNE